MQFHVVRHVESGDAKNNYYGFQFDNNALCYTMTRYAYKKPRYTTILLTVNVSKICCSKI